MDYRTSVHLGVVNEINMIKDIPGLYDETVDKWKTMFTNLFSGKNGKLKGHSVRLNIDESVRPVQQKLRHVPDRYHSKKRTWRDTEMY